MKPVVGLMARAPEPGRVMTRLGEQVGMLQAARFYAGCLAWWIVRTREGGFPLVWFYDPPGAERRLRRAYGRGGELELVPQSGNNLGVRMYRALEHLRDRYDRPGVLVGSDCPDLPLRDLARAGAWLSSKRVVLGPARDGGYYLVGTSRSTPRLFEGMEWSRSDVLARTLRRACGAGFSVGLLPVRRDLDTLEDLEARKETRSGGATP